MSAPLRPQAPRDFIAGTQLPGVLAEPMIYLSKRQARVAAELPMLEPYVPFLPGWVPLRVTSHALMGRPSTGLKVALAKTGKPSVWAPEFNIAHNTWDVDEPSVEHEGDVYAHGLAMYAHLEEEHKAVTVANGQEPFGFLWDSKRVDAMRNTVTARFDASEELREVLEGTVGHPLLCTNPDHLWGFDTVEDAGANALGILTHNYRAKLFPVADASWRRRSAGAPPIREIMVVLPDEHAYAGRKAAKERVGNAGELEAAREQRAAKKPRRIREDDE